MLLGMVSCNKATDEPVQETGSEAVPAKVSLWAQLGDDTKASYAAGGKVSWELGDKLVLHNGTVVKGALTCISTGAGGKGFFSGEAAFTDPTSETVNVFFLGNRDVAADATNITVDFSAQDGTATGVSRFIFLSKASVVFKNDGATYMPADAIAFDKSYNAMMEMTFSGAGCPEGTPGESGYKAKKVTIQGLTNKLTINLASMEATSGHMEASAPYKTTINPGSVSKYANTYYLSVAPAASNTAITITADYQDGGTGTSTVMWNPMSWATMAAGNWYYINWATKTLVQYSSKPGYNGQAVTGGENADGTNHKGGYNGVNADGSVDNPTGNKGGYNGTDVM